MESRKSARLLNTDTDFSRLADFNIVEQVPINRFLVSILNCVMITSILRENFWKKFPLVEDFTQCPTFTTGLVIQFSVDLRWQKLSKDVDYNHAVVDETSPMQSRKRQKSDVDKIEKRRQRSERGKSSNIEVHTKTKTNTNKKTNKKTKTVFRAGKEL